MAKPIITRVSDAPDIRISRLSQSSTEIAGSVRIEGTADLGVTIRIAAEGALAGDNDPPAFVYQNGSWQSSAFAANIVNDRPQGSILTAGLHSLTALSYASETDPTPLAVSDPVVVNIGTAGADQLQGLTLGSTITGSDHVFGFNGNDTITAYVVVNDAAGRHATGGRISIDGGFEVSGYAPLSSIYDGGLDTLVIPVALSDGPSQLVRLLSRNGIAIATPDATVAFVNIEKLAFTDATLTPQYKPLNDFLYYAARYHDLAVADVNAEQHYDLFGWREGRDPNAFFSTAGYLGANADVKAAVLNPLFHYDTVGWKEGRDPSAAFDTSLYLAFHPDVAAARIDPLAHYLSGGLAEGRKISPVVDGARLTADGFDATYYRLANPDVAVAGIDAYQHYLAIGWKEGRDPDAFFDTTGYLRQNPDVAAAGINPLLHFMAIGWHEGRNPSSHFDTGAYLANNPDVAAAGVNPLQHFLQSGIIEGRSAYGDLF